MLEETELLECCHEMSLNVGGVDVNVSVFVIHHCGANIILERL